MTEEHANDSDLNYRQRRFLLEYLRNPDPTQAAIAAGYSEKTAHRQGQRLLKHPIIDMCLQLVQVELWDDVREILEELGAIAFSRITDYATWDEDREVTFYPVSQISEKKISAIKRVIEKTTLHQLDDGTEVTTVNLGIELYDKVSACATILKLFKGLEYDPIDATGVPVPVIIPPDRAGTAWQVKN